MKSFEKHLFLSPFHTVSLIGIDHLRIWKYMPHPYADASISGSNRDLVDMVLSTLCDRLIALFPKADLAYELSRIHKGEDLTHQTRTLQTLVH